MSLEVFNVAKLISSHLFVCALTYMPGDNLMKLFFEGLVRFLLCGGRLCGGVFLVFFFSFSWFFPHWFISSAENLWNVLL